MTGRRERFTGFIAGVGTTSGTRLVVGHWPVSPFGPFADVMVEDTTGHRTLLAPTPEVAEFVAQTYTFDETVLGPVRVAADRHRWLVTAGPGLTLHLDLGRRAALGWALRAVPRRLATSPAWAAAVDPLARIALRGVRTRGVAREGRREWYGATDLHRVTALAGEWRGQTLGGLTTVDPPCRFGFSSTPRTPSVTTVTSTVEIHPHG